LSVMPERALIIPPQPLLGLRSAPQQDMTDMTPVIKTQAALAMDPYCPVCSALQVRLGPSGGANTGVHYCYHNLEE
jgi:hypothetical protein